MTVNRDLDNPYSYFRMLFLKNQLLYIVEKILFNEINKKLILVESFLRKGRKYHRRSCFPDTQPTSNHCGQNCHFPNFFSHISFQNFLFSVSKLRIIKKPRTFAFRITLATLTEIPSSLSLSALTAQRLKVNRYC